MDVKEIYRIAFDPKLKTIAELHTAAAQLSVIRDQYQEGDPEWVACNEGIEALSNYAVSLTLLVIPDD